MFTDLLFRAGRLDLGFNQDDTCAMSVDLETRQYSPERGRLFQRQVQEALLSVPGVLSVTAADIVPVTLSSTVIGLRRADGSSETIPAEPPLAVHTNAISPGHFATLRIPMVSGRDFDDRDVDGRPLVAIVNETLARRLWPGEPAIGKHVHRGTETTAGIEVVGVVRDSKYATPGEEPKPFAYRPLAQAYTPRVTFLMRAAPGVTGVLEEARRVIHGLDGNLAIYNADSLSRITEVSRLPARVAAGFATVLAAAALGLAGLGTFSLLAFSSRRERVNSGSGWRWEQPPHVCSATSSGWEPLGSSSVSSSASVSHWPRPALFAASSMESAPPTSPRSRSLSPSRRYAALAPLSARRCECFAWIRCGQFDRSEGGSFRGERAHGREGNTMMAIPISVTAAPIRSHRSGRTPSTAHSHRSAVAT